jgi:hypothetical protein
MSCPGGGDYGKPSPGHLIPKHGDADGREIGEALASALERDRWPERCSLERGACEVPVRGMDNRMQHVRELEEFEK